MTYDPECHRRRSLRVKGYNYAQEGAYFVTVCAQDRACMFGEVVNGEMGVNVFGEMVRAEWFQSAEIRQEIELFADEFVVMPNHIHGILWIVEPGDGMTGAVGAHGRAPLVRPRGRLISRVEVPVGVSQDSVAEGNCVAARRGGEQPKANWRSVGQRT